MAKFELRQVIGQTNIHGKTRRVGWDMDIVLMDGRQIATINRVPGAAIQLLPSAALTESEKKQLARKIAVERGGIEPERIGSPVKMPYELLDDEEEEETDVDNE